MDKFLYAQSQFSDAFFWFVVISMAWSFPWKGVALWRAAQNSDKRWFLVLFLINTLAVLDILYIFIWGKKKK